MSARKGGGLGECTWDDDLGEGHVVVGDKHEFEGVADVGVGVDLGADGADELDDALGHLVARRRLAADHAHARHHL